ncbi:cupin domain-containing protein [Haloarcula amylovorans]|uniref:cupin domain-containing protein n=1 Tax=Haloarcula amylovorans TaxID=2562280 RepID=UPI0010762AA1
MSAGEGTSEHYHVEYEETFEVLSGELTVVEGTPRRVSAGKSYTVPAGTVHKPRYDELLLRSLPNHYHATHEV